MELDLDFDLDLKAIVLIGILIAAAIGAAYAILSFVYPLHSTGKIQKIGIEVKDANGTTITNIDWGNLTPNSTITYNIVVANNGTVPVTLTFETENWNPPEISNYITVTWNYDGVPLNPQSSKTIALILTVAENINGISSFSFDIKIIAQEVFP